jgi:predicted DNA-binding protein with PD1-like motif
MKSLTFTQSKHSSTVIVVLVTAFVLLTGLGLAQSTLGKPKASSAGKIKRVFRLGLGPGDSLLESIRDFIRENKIKDGAIMTGIGSLSECRLHWPKEPVYPPENVFATFKGALEITSLQGIIAESEPHLHIILAEKGDTRTLGGHLEDGSKVLYLAEITIAEFDGPAMTRRPNQHNVKMLQLK